MESEQVAAAAERQVERVEQRTFYGLARVAMVAVLVRGSEGGKQYSVRLKDLLKRGDISANVDVKPGDIIIVPQSWF